ncbi:MAG: peptidylprolyl isomerase [Sulfurimonas sp.]|nr:peptidylprolyl isomerase [Sulfurimonas sp.]MDQ7059669.1 peptidylprolyl isomerase [Sulfurimonas sp.]
MTINKKIISILFVVTSSLSAQTLVTVDGTKITKNDVDTILMNATQGRMNQLEPAKQIKFRKEVLQQLVAKVLIYNDATKTGILKSKEFKAEYAKVQEKVKKEVAIQIWQQKQFDKVSVSNKTLRDYYNKNKGEYKEEQSVHARHILVAGKSEAKAIIKDLKGLKGEKLKTKFMELAKAKSTGPSSVNGGDLGTFAKGKMVPEFNKEVFNMKVGTISGAVKTQFGYHIIYLEEKNKAKNLTYKEVKPFIEQRLKMEKFKGSMKSKMASLQKKATIK